MQLTPLYPNPGGVIDPDELVGRTDELQRLTEALSRSGGAYLTGERRMGKTSLLAKLETKLTEAGRTVIRISAETSRTDTFADRLMRELRKHSVLSRKIRKWEKEFEGEARLAIGETGIRLRARAAHPPQDAQELDLIDLLASVSDHAGAVLIIDEITVLCQELGPEAAAEFLRSLRAERQGHSLALVLAGSIGLHHAIKDTQVINDSWKVPLGPLSESEARELTERLLLGIGAPANGPLITEIAAETSRIPYYIQGVVDRLRGGAHIGIGALIDQAIADDDWHTKHYVSRLDEYYGDSAAIARSVLDELALASPGGQTLEELQAILTTDAEQVPARDDLLELLDNLEKDHYLTRDGTHDRMSSALLARIWRIHRRL